MNTPYRGHIHKNASPGTTVQGMSVTACYLRDSSCISAGMKYYLYGKDSQLFQIARLTGALTTSESIPQIVSTEFELEVVAEVSGSSEFTDVLVEVTEYNVFTPVFTQSSYDLYVFRLAQAHSHVTVLRAQVGLSHWAHDVVATLNQRH